MGQEQPEQINLETLKQQMIADEESVKSLFTEWDQKLQSVIGNGVAEREIDNEFGPKIDEAMKESRISFDAWMEKINDEISE